MSIPKTILNYLKKNNIEVRVEGHKKVYTAYDLAKTMNEKLDKIGKSLLVKVDGKPYLVLVPGHYHLDLGKIKKELKAKKVELANEKQVKKIMNTKLGALHPFTGIHKVELLLDKALLKSKEAIVRAGSFTESLRMQTKDLHKLENATVGEFGKMVVQKGKKTVKAMPKKVKKAVKAVKKAEGKIRKAVKTASSSKAGRMAKKTVKKAYKKAVRTKAGKKAVKRIKKTIKKIKKTASSARKSTKNTLKKIEKRSPVKINISKIPAIKRKRR